MAIAYPVAVYSAENNLEAELLCTYLGNNGIEAYPTWDESRVATWMFGNLSQVHNPQVWVDQTNVEAAAPLLINYERERSRRQPIPKDAPVSDGQPIDEPFDWSDS
jgi:hypothetical protein